LCKINLRKDCNIVKKDYIERLAVFLGDTRIGLAAKTVPNSSDFSFDPKNDEKF